MTTVFPSPLPDVEIPATTITDQVFRYAGRLADRTAIIDGLSGRRYTYGELHSAVLATAGGLSGRGLRKGDVVAILAPNLPEYAIVFHAVATVGGIVTTINPSHTVGEITTQLADSETRMIFTIPPFLEPAHAAASASGVEHVFVMGDGEESSFAELSAADPFDDTPDIDPSEDVVVLPYSSGTTGRPKGVQLTHRNLVANLVQYEQITTTGVTDVVLAVLPFFHIYGMQVLMNGVLHMGARSVTMPFFDLEGFLRIIQDQKVTRVAVVPPIVLAIAKSPLVDKYDLSSLVQVGSGAAPLSAELAGEAMRRIGAPVVQGFGLTETSPVTHAMPPGEVRSGSIGVPIPNTEIRVIDPQKGGDLGVGEPGELWIRGPQVMKGYLNNEEATKASIDDQGWLHTGDIGHVDEDGYWYVTDRIKELIKYKGFQVAPAELEAVLLTHPAVADAAIIGVDDEESGEIPKAFVVRGPDDEVTTAELMKYVSDRVAGYKQIRQIEFIDAVPKSLSGKILRRVLRERDSAAAP
jgi:acyl-CoA synthetase (AMP-forming)/AMP-acid ligase II